MAEGIVETICPCVKVYYQPSLWGVAVEFFIMLFYKKINDCKQKPDGFNKKI